MTTRTSGALVGAGAALALAVLLALQVLTGNGLPGTRTETVTTTVTPTSQAANAVSGSFAEHMLLLDSRNVSGIVDQYDGNATLTWTGREGPAAMRGPAVGADAIRGALDAFLFQPCGSHDTVSAFSVDNVTRTLAAASDSSVTVNSTFHFTGNSSLWGVFNGTISAQDLFSYSAKSGAWLISLEAWDFLGYTVEYPVNPGMIC